MKNLLTGKDAQLSSSNLTQVQTPLLIPWRQSFAKLRNEWVPPTKEAQAIKLKSKYTSSLEAKTFDQTTRPLKDEDNGNKVTKIAVEPLSETKQT